MIPCKKVISCLLTVAMFVTMFLGNLAAPTVAAAQTPSPIQLSVDWSTVKSTTTNLSFGLNGFLTFDPAVASNSDYKANMEYMNIGFIRYHSSEATSSNSATHPTNWVDVPNKTWLASKVKEALSGFKVSNNPIRMININTWPNWMKTYTVTAGTNKVTLLDPSEYDNYANYCAELVRIVNIQYGHNVKYWEPTNEADDAYYVKFAEAGYPDKLDELIEIYSRCAKAMKAVDPTIKVGGLAYARSDHSNYDAVRRFVQATLKEGTLDYLSYHFYASGNAMDSDSSVYNRAYNPNPSSTSMAKHSRDIRNILDEYSPNRHIELFMDEYNISWSWTINDPRMKNNKGAVFDALGMIYSHDAGVDGFLAWNEKDDVYGKMDNQHNLRPPAHVYQMMNNYMVGDRVATTSSDEGKIAPFAVKNKTTGEKSYLLVNRTDEAQTVSTSFMGATGTGLVRQHQVSVEGYKITQSNWDSIVGKEVTLPANSVTLFTESQKEPTKMPMPTRVLRTLSPSIDGPTGPYDLNLTGTLDWMAFARTGVADIDRRQGSTSTIAYNRIGTSSSVRIGSNTGHAHYPSQGYT